MSIVDQIKSLSWDQFIIGLFIVLGAISPGFLLLYLYKLELFLELEFLKLAVLSLSFSLPVIAANLAFSLKTADEKDGEYEILGSALLLSAVAFYTGLLGAYLLQLQFKGFLALLLAIEIVLCIFDYVATQRKRAKRDS